MSAQKNRTLKLTTSKHIIVLDDDVATLDAIKRVLRAHGFNAELFNTVEDLLSRAHLEGAICLLLDVDVNGMSGIDLARQLARSGNSLPVIFMTGSEGEAIRQAAIEAGCIGYLRKPFSSKLLITAIERIVLQEMAAR